MAGRQIIRFTNIFSSDSSLPILNFELQTFKELSREKRISNDSKLIAPVVDLLPLSAYRRERETVFLWRETRQESAVRTGEKVATN